MRPVAALLILFLYGILIFYSCKKEYSCENCREDNKPPIANAGRDTIIILPVDSTTIDGSASTDADGIIVSYRWKQLAGPSSSFINNPGDSITIVKKMLVGNYQFELMVTDDGSLLSRDTVAIKVQEAGINNPPIAKAGADQKITLPDNSIALDGSGSVDLENNIASYGWTKIAGPASFSIPNSNAAQIQVNNLAEGTYLFELKVTDAGGLSSKDTVQVIVFAPVVAMCPLTPTLIGKLPVYRYAFVGAATGNKIVYAGGFEVNNGSVASTRVDLYDIVTKTWTVKQLNHGGHVGVIAAGDKIFIAGGYTSAGNKSASVDIYNTSDNTWSSAMLSEARHAIKVLKAGDKILFAGGYTDLGPSTRVDIFDLSSSTWSSASLSQAYGDYGIALGDKAIIGVVNGGVDIYDASNNSWSTKNFNYPHRGKSVATLGTKIYLAGGYSDVNNSGNYYFSDAVLIYDVATNSWTETTMSQPKALITSIGASGAIFWIGGFDSSWSDAVNDYVRNVEDIEIYDVHTGTHAHHPFPQNTIVSSVVMTANHIMFQNGGGLGYHVFDFTTLVWTACNTEFGWAPTLLSYGDKIYVAGPLGNLSDNITVWELEF